MDEAQLAGLIPAGPTGYGEIKVLHVVLALDPGGLEMIVLDLLREDMARGNRPEVLCLERPGVLAPLVAGMGATLHCAEKAPGVRPDTIRPIARMLARVRPDIVHTHQIGALFYAGPATRFGRNHLVVHTEHGRYFDATRRSRALARIAALSARRFFCVSEDIAAAAESGRIAPRRKLRVIRNGVDVSRFSAEPGPDSPAAPDLGIPSEAPVVGTVGRLDEVKRQDRLIRAFAGVVREVPESHLLIVGDGPLMGELRGLADGLGVGEKVHLAGYQSRPELFLAMMDVFALTSRSEGMPLSVLEAWAAGLPVVASRVGGLPEMVAQGETGLLFEPDDEPALAAHLIGLLRDPGRRRRMGAAGLEVVRRDYSLQAMAETYHRHYVELLSSSRRPHAAG